MNATDTEEKRDTEYLRQRLLNEMYAGAVSGFPAQILDEAEIRNADGETLVKIAQRYGIK